MRYSKMTNGFYPEEIDYPELPDDIIIIGDELYQQLKGKAIEPGGDGVPRIRELPPLTQAQLIAQAEKRKASLFASATAEIAWRQDAVDAGIATEEETISLANWKKYRVLLMRVDTSDPAWPDKPE